MMVHFSISFDWFSKTISKVQLIFVIRFIAFRILRLSCKVKVMNQLNEVSEIVLFLGTFDALVCEVLYYLLAQLFSIP